METAAPTGRRWLWLAGAAVVALVLFILFDPGVDDRGEGDALIWERDWRVIEHLPAETAQTEQGDSEKARDEEVAFDPDAVKGKFRFRLLRRPGLYEDDFTVETPRAGRPGAQLVRHTGNLTVRNIFREWNQPKYKAVYDRRTALELDREMTENSRRLLLYPAEDAEPVTVYVGRKLDNGNTVIKTSAEPESVFLIPTVFLSKFDYVFTNYRLKRVLYYPTGSYSSEIEILRGEDGARLLLRQKREKQEEKVNVVWYSGDDTELSLNNASQIDNYVKQIQVDLFDDQAESVPGRASLDELWKQAGKDAYVIRVKIAGGQETTLRLRGGSQALRERLESTAGEKKKTGEDFFLLLRTSSRDKTHLTAGRHFKNLRTKMTQVLSEIQTRKREAEQKRKAEELRAQQKEQQQAPGQPTPGPGNE